MLLSGCSGSSYFGQKSPPIVTVLANPTSVTAGGTSTLTVTATYATSVTVAGSDGSSYTLATTGGTQAVTPAATTTYTATATGPGGSITATATVTVTPPVPPTVTIAANPTTVTLGGSSTLKVVAANATAVTVTGSDGSSYTLSTTGGTQSVTPTATTTYTATATGVAGTSPASNTATVTVNIPQPTVAISAKPTGILLGASSVLTVAAANATVVTIAGSDGSSYTLGATGGTQSVSPTATTTYTATATGAPGSVPATVTAIATVTVTAPAPTVNIIANPTSITATQSSILTVTASNASTVTITGTDSSSYSLTATGGVQSVSPTTTTTYTATATGPGGTVSKTAKVTVTEIPAPTVNIQALPTSISAGQSSTLTVTATNANQNVTLTGSDNSSYTLSQAGGSQVVSPTATTTYTASGTGTGGTTTAIATVTVTPNPSPSVTISASPATIAVGNSTTLTVTASNATAVSIAGSDGSSYTLTGNPNSQQTQSVTPNVSVPGPASVPVTYTATATGQTGQQPATSQVTVTVEPQGSLNSINHVIFMLQENHTFDNYFGMLNPYRENPLGTGTCPNNASGVPQCWNIGDDGNTYNVDGIDDKLPLTSATPITNVSDTTPPVETPPIPSSVTYHLYPQQSTCIFDDSSDWLASFGDVNRYYAQADRNTSTSPDRILMDGFVHDGQGYDISCKQNGCTGQAGATWTDTLGARAMGYYDQGYLNYYYYMASQFALSDRWFSPVASKSADNRIATFSGGTTQGLVKDPGSDDHLTQQLAIPTIFGKLTAAGVSWKIYYTVNQALCYATEPDDCQAGASQLPSSWFLQFQEAFQYVQTNTSAPDPTFCATVNLQPSSVSPINDTTNSFCIDPTHIVPLAQYYTDLVQGTLPQFAFIEPGYGRDDEHPGYNQSILLGQNEVSTILNAFMNTAGTASDYWSNSVFFLAYDEGGGPYDHVPPVPGHSNDLTTTGNYMGYLGDYPNSQIPDIAGIAVNPDTTAQYPMMYFPCPAPGGVATVNCDLTGTEPGMAANPPGDIVTEDGFAAQLGFRVPNLIVSPFVRKHYVSHTPIDHTAIIKFVENRFIGPSAHMTNRDAAQPDLLEFFDFTNIPWAAPPQNVPNPKPDSAALCKPSMHPMDGVAPQ